MTKLNKMNNTDYIIYDNARGRALTFSNGEIIFYGDKQEAFDDLRGDSEEIMLYTKYTNITN